MAGLTKDVTLKNGETFTIRRPSLKTFKTTAKAVEQLMGLTPEQMMEDSEKLEAFGNRTTADIFFDLLRDAVTDKERLEALLESGDYLAAFELWDAYVEHGEFEDFFALRQKLSQAQSAKRQEQAEKLAEAQMERGHAAMTKMQKKGLLPKDFTVIDFLMLLEGLSSGNLQTLRFLQTYTPESTDGLENISSPKTTGSSPETISRSSGAAAPQGS
jgi:hypothetical protein